MIFGLDATPLPSGYTPLEAVAIVKALDAEGRVELLLRSTASLNSWEAIGMLAVAFDTEKAGLVAAFEDEDEDDDA